MWISHGEFELFLIRDPTKSSDWHFPLILYYNCTAIIKEYAEKKKSSKCMGNLNINFPT